VTPGAPEEPEEEEEADTKPAGDQKKKDEAKPKSK